MIPPETRAQIRRFFCAEHWKIGTIAQELNVHPDAVRNAIEAERFNTAQPVRGSITDPYLRLNQCAFCGIASRWHNPFDSVASRRFPVDDRRVSRSSNSYKFLHSYTTVTTRRCANRSLCTAPPFGAKEG